MRRLWLFSVLIYFFRNRQGLVPSLDFRLVDAHTRTERLASLRFSFCALRFPHEGQDRSVDFVMNPGSRISHANFNGNAQRSPAAMIHQRKTRKNVDKRHRLEINKKKLISKSSIDSIMSFISSPFQRRLHCLGTLSSRRADDKFTNFPFHFSVCRSLVMLSLFHAPSPRAQRATQKVKFFFP